MNNVASLVLTLYIIIDLSVNPNLIKCQVLVGMASPWAFLVWWTMVSWKILH